MKRHIGKMLNTDQRCVIAFMQIPGRDSHALVIPIDGLPPRHEQALMEVLESPEGQADPTLANVLGRRMLADTGKSILQSFHDLGYLHAVDIDNVIMLPVPNMPFALRKVIEQLGGTVSVTTTQTPTEASSETKFNPYGKTQEFEDTDTTRAIARNLLVEADLIEGDAVRLTHTAQTKREQAYGYDPSLRPTVPKKPTPKVSVTEVPVTTLQQPEPKPKGSRKKAA